VLIAVLVVSVAGATEIRLLSHKEFAGSEFITDVWGYVDSGTGKRFALIGDWTSIIGFRVVEATNPLDPVQASRVSQLRRWTRRSS
jgi:hypothetical protein